jgi:hypothetical protein
MGHNTTIEMSHVKEVVTEVVLGLGFVCLSDLLAPQSQ